MTRMPIADCPFRGEGSKMCMATVTEGPHAKQIVAVLVQYQDGFCICDMGDDNPMEVIHISKLKLWTPVRWIKVDDNGQVTCEPVTREPVVEKPRNHSNRLITEQAVGIPRLKIIKEPHLIDNADGVRGRFCIGRQVDHVRYGKIYEYWNDSNQEWCSFGSLYIGKEAAEEKLKEIIGANKMINQGEIVAQHAQ